jgi:hypothetical protein
LFDLSLLADTRRFEIVPNLIYLDMNFFHMHDNTYFCNKNVSSQDYKVNNKNEKKLMFSFFFYTILINIYSERKERFGGRKFSIKSSLNKPKTLFKFSSFVY